jgi:hypothetical protein
MLSNSSVPFTNIYSLPIFSNGNLIKPYVAASSHWSWSNYCIITPPNEPEFTAIGLSDSTRAPIILELLEVVFE